ncbi:MAG: hypothetical protein JSR77_12980 [Planctomycetes bacterium]|nr:hypothetical protein [Planctomycetota bacterium]
MGQATDQRRGGGGVEPGLLDPNDGAAWIAEQLAGTRNTSSLSMLVLDVEGSGCSWLSAPSSDPQVLAAVARFGGASQGDSETGGGRVSATLEYYAPTAMDSSIQSLSMNGHAAPKERRRKGTAAHHTHRMPVLAMTDVPARLLIDALDGRGIPVESVASLWHALAQAWDPAWSATPKSDDPLTADAGAYVTGVIVADPAGRLVWAWCRGGKLLVAGSMRVRMNAVAGGDPNQPAASVLQFGPDESARLVAEWLAWAAQTGFAPARIVCVMPEDDGGAAASAFGEALAKAWPNATIDAALHADPLGATLARLASRVEQTPQTAALPTGTDSLVDLSFRRGRDHRRLFVWSAAAIAALAGALGIWAWRLGSVAKSTREAAAVTEEQWRALVKQHYPAAFTGAGVIDPIREVELEADRLGKKVKPPERLEFAKPVLEELEVVSMVLGNQDYALESVNFDNSRAQFTLIANSTQDAADVEDALKSIAGSAVSWAMEEPRPDPRNANKVRAVFNAKWPTTKPSKPN